ncbi:MAG: FAD-binding protein [Pseudomonadota bacterium]
MDGMDRVETPDSEAGVCAVVQGARAAREPIEIVGGGTRRALGRPVQAARSLSLCALTGITHYEPGALTIGAAAGTPLEEINAALAAEGQRLSFEPLDHRRLLASEGAPTIGAVAACNLSGPRRIVSGACRDSLIGVRFVDGTGDVVKNGGRVMKNVTGYDLVKLLCGSWGTLGVLTEVTIKVQPISERAVTLVIHDLDIVAAVATMSAALSSPYEVSGAAHLPGAPSRTVLRIEGFARQVDYRLARLADRLKVTPDTLEGAAHDALWREIRDMEPFAGDTRPVWRLSVRPSDAPALGKALQERCGADLMLDWGGGLMVAKLPDTDDAGAAAVREELARFGGHATLTRAPAQLRAAVPVFQPPAPRVAALSEAIRQTFDPDRILNPGRMAA